MCISSTATWHGNWGTYGIAKAGVEGLVRSFAAEGAALGVRCNGVSPGWISTERDDEDPPSGGGAWSLPPSALNRMGTPAEIAAAVLFLASDEASFVTGQTLVVDGGLMMLDYPSMKMLETSGPGMMSGDRHRRTGPTHADHGQPGHLHRGDGRRHAGRLHDRARHGRRQHLDAVSQPPHTVPAADSPKAFRIFMEIVNDWLRIFGIPTGCFFLPIGSMLVLACLEGGLSFWHWPVALIMFAVLMVWRLR